MSDTLGDVNGQVRALGLLVSVCMLQGCASQSSTQRPTQTGYPQQGYPQQGYPQQGYPQQGYPQGNQTGYPPGTQTGYPQGNQTSGSAQQGNITTQTGPLLAPLVGSQAQQAEVAMVLAELVSALGANEQSKVQGIPLQYDSTLEINAFAGCRSGRSYMAATEGLLQTIDAIAQTNATDEMYGTRTYEAYLAQVLPRLVRADSFSPALPMGVIPPQYLAMPQRLSRARQIYQEVLAFTFGHELAHHYLDHTGCANGTQGTLLGGLANLGNLVTSAVPTFNQPLETMADQWGAHNALNAGLRRAQSGQYRWTERGGLLLLDFFSRLERAAGGNSSLLSPMNLLRSHPNPGLRLPLVRGAIQQWYARNPGAR